MSCLVHYKHLGFWEKKKLRNKSSSHHLIYQKMKEILELEGTLVTV